MKTLAEYPTTLAEFETALDNGQVYCLWHSDNWNLIRRAGATKRWKNDPNRFVIPYKSGIRDYGRIVAYERDCLQSGGHSLNSPYLRIVD